MKDQLVDELILSLARADRRDAARRCAQLVAEGMPLVALVDDGLAPAMNQVGTNWELAMWTVADEHLATAVAEAALSAAAAECRPAPPRGDVVVACVEGDWHSLPARMLAEVLESEGWQVRFLGASQPTGLLAEHVGRHRPDAVMLSCAVPMALPELATAVDLIHAHGLPVYAGGRALGTSPQRALTLGADGWAADAAGALTLLERHPVVAPDRSEPGVELEDYRSREQLVPAWAAAALDVLAGSMATVAAYPPAVRERTLADLHHLLVVALLSLFVDDPGLADEQCHWLQGLLDARNVPAGALGLGLDALVASRPADRLADQVTDALALARAHLATASV